MSGCSGLIHPNQSVAVIDIGSNSVRLVVYEALTRAPTPLFNEKVLCGLGQEVMTTGLLKKEAMERAYGALSRFKALCTAMKVSKTYAIATAAARDAKNGAEFITHATQIIGSTIRLLSGEEEAKYAAFGVISGVYQPDGIVGDMGGGSLELVDIKSMQGLTLPLGGLAIHDRAGKNHLKAADYIEKQLKTNPLLKEAKGKIFYAVGGSFRALAKQHMSEINYPLRVIHNYSLSAKEAIEFCKRLVKNAPLMRDTSDQRGSLLPYGAMLLQEIMAKGKFDRVVFSALGVREGLLYEELTKIERQKDALLVAGDEFCQLRSRSSQHSYELYDWISQFLGSEDRLDKAVCLLADIGWRAHPDYRGDQSLAMISNAALVQISHAERVFLSLAVYFRHVGITDISMTDGLLKLTSPMLLERAKVLGLLMRIAFLISGAMGGTLPKTKLFIRDKRLILELSSEIAMLSGEKLHNRVKALSKFLKLEADIQIK